MLRIKKQLRLSQNCFCQSAQSLRSSFKHMCEKFEAHQDRSGESDVLMGQSIVLGEIKTEVPLENDIPSHQNLLMQRYEKRIEMLSQENKVSKFYMDAGFISVVEIGQWVFHDLKHWRTILCKGLSWIHSSKGRWIITTKRIWIQGSTKIGAVLDVTTSQLQGKHGVEIRIWSLSGDNTQSWIRISHGSNKFVMDSNNNDRNFRRSAWRTSLTSEGK